MDERAIGIILRTRPLTETSLIVHWLTPELGRIATVSKGARRPKSPFRGKLDLFYVCDFTFVRSRRSELHALREATLRETNSNLRKDLGWLEQATYAALLIEQATETETPLAAFYDLLTGLVKHLPAHPPEARTLFAFELKLLAELGLQPDLAASPLTPGAREILKKLAALDWPALSCLKPTIAQARELQLFLHRLLAEHLDRIPASRTSALGLE